MQQSPSSFRRAWKRRALSLLMALVLVLGLLPGVPGLGGGASAHWADSYLSQLVEWGFIRADQAGYPDRALTRADFMAITNRAYGYHETGETPFEDVAENDWFYDDVGIAYTARYIKGTSPTTASPRSTLTRETAATILGRNMMLQESAGELLDFTDARQISSWARGTVKSSLEHYLVSGYDDGTFRPQRNVSWGEMAAMVTKLIGTPLQEPGDYALGGTFGNVTITSPGVILRDTVVSGDLYVTGGVGLGDVQLENVTVLGRIIASGTGNSEGGGASILLRNVTADELLVDNLQDNPVSVRADGITEIGHTTVRTTAYIEDNTPDGMGLHYISLEGESYPEGEEPEDWTPPALTLAGRIEEVVNKTPNSLVHAAAGTVAKLTVDEAAAGSSVAIDRNTTVKELNLDTAATVTGEGDIGKLVVSAPGCVVEMLPDEIEIRPGIIAEIAGEEMDSVAARESSEEPRILAGYPEARDIIPTGLDAVFMTNKAGTVYWAVSAITDGSIGEEDLIKPPSYGSLAVSNGSLKVAKGNEETTAKVGRLTPGGSYYLSAVLVDARDKRSAVKVISFTTPDNTTPAFCSGYPRMSKVSRTDSMVVVMPNKDCKLYYALLPEGATAPTENELKTSSVSGALGYGVRDVTKNVEDTFRVNDVILDETTNYVLYLWLVDADGVNKGKIVPLKFTTDDETPPYFTSGPTQNKTAATSVGLDFTLSEAGTVYWVAVPVGTIYPKPEPGTDFETAPLTSDYAKLQVSTGMNLGNGGKAGKVTVKEGANGTINISGLKPETVYDLYYLAKDNAGPNRNYSVAVGHMTINTQDDSSPIFTQSFSNTSGSDKTKDPRSNSAIYLDVSEDVLYSGQGGGVSFLELYQEASAATGDAKTQAVNRLAENLYNSIKLHKYDIQSRREEDIHLKYQLSDSRNDWVLDYTKVTIARHGQNGGIRITFPSDGVQLENGGQYCFTINGLADTSIARNPVEPESGIDFWNDEQNSKRPGHSVPPFVVASATVTLDVPVLGANLPYVRENKAITDSLVRMDQCLSFYMEPNSTSTVADTVSYDVLLWSGNTVTYDLFYRIVEPGGTTLHELKTGSTTEYEYPDTVEEYMLPQASGMKGSADVDKNGWIYLGNSELVNPPANGRAGRSISWFFNDCDSSKYAQLNKLSDELHYQFVIRVTSYEGNATPTTWNGDVKFYVNVAAGQAYNLEELASSLTPSYWEQFQKQGIIRGAESIGRWQNDQNQIVDTQDLFRRFTDTSLPTFINDAPEFTVKSDSVSIGLSLSSAGSIHYAIAEAEGDNGKPTVTTVRNILESDYKKNADGNYVDKDGNEIPADELGSKGVLLEGVETLGSNPSMMYVTVKSPRPPQKGGTSLTYPMLDWMNGGTTNTSVPDDPEGENQIQEPTSLRVVSKDWQNRVVDSGVFTPQEGVTDPLVSDKVKPKTTYFAYFVITSVENYDIMSHVYIYQFTTPDSMKPSVVLDASDGSGNVTMSIDVATKGYYRIFSESDAMNNRISILNKPFSEYTEYTGENGKRQTPDAYLKKNGGSDDFTVLDALTTPYSYNIANPGQVNDPETDSYYYPDRDGDYWEFEEGYTVFDMYASDTARSYLYTFIRQGLLASPESVNVDHWGPTGETNTKDPKPPAEREDTVLDTGKDLNDSRYVFLTYAINPDMVQSGTNANSSQNTYMIASFSGLIFQKGQMRPPEVDDADGYISKDGLTDTYTGEITIYFDRATYLKGANGAVPITTGNIFSGGQTVNRPASGSMTPKGVTTTSLTFNIKSARINDRLSFPRSYFADQTNDEAAKALTIRISREDDTVYLIVEWGSEEVCKIPASDGSGGYAVLLTGTGGSVDNPTLELDATSATAKAKSVTASMTPTGDLEDGITYRWQITSGADVVSVTPNSAATTTITGLRPGKATVRVTATGYNKNDGNVRTATKDIVVTVKGEIEAFTCTPSTGSAWDADTSTLTVPAGTATTAENVYVKATGGATPGNGISETAKLVYTVNGTATQYASLANTIHDAITVTTKRNSADGSSITVAVDVVAQDDGESLLKSGGKSFTVTFRTPTTFRAAASVKPTDLTFSNVSGAKLASGALKLTSSSMSSTIKATIKPSAATGAITWESSNPDVASVTKTGSQVTITGKTAGTTVITAAVGSVRKSITVTVAPAITVTGLTPNSSISTVTKGSDGSYTWTRSSGTSAAAKLKFSSNLSLENEKVSVHSSDDKAVSIGKETMSGKTGEVQLTFGSMNESHQVTITIKAGSVSQTVTIKLVGSDVSANLLKAKKS